MGEIFKLQCDICGKIWEEKDKLTFGVLKIMSPTFIYDPKNSTANPVKIETFYLCNDCIQNDFDPIKIKNNLSRGKKEK
jgi:hypothetical protein